jgi:DNA-binding MarR family transcriptional regulator
MGRTHLLALNVSRRFRFVKNLDKKILDIKLSNMNTNEASDVIDHLLAAWRMARPDLDPSPLALVGRVIVLAQRLEQSVGRALAKHGLTLGQFDILATLRRHGPRGGLTPSELLRSVVLSSGGMTARLDKLEEAGWISRVADAQDRRKVVIELTPKGRRLIDAATATRFEEARSSLPPLSDHEQSTLAALLRRWLTGLSTTATASDA